jgi:hypothetical protein
MPPTVRVLALLCVTPAVAARSGRSQQALDAPEAQVVGGGERRNGGACAPGGDQVGACARRGVLAGSTASGTAVSGQNGVRPGSVGAKLQVKGLGGVRVRGEHLHSRSTRTPRRWPGRPSLPGGRVLLGGPTAHAGKCVDASRQGLRMVSSHSVHSTSPVRHPLVEAEPCARWITLARITGRRGDAGQRSSTSICLARSRFSTSSMMGAGVQPRPSWPGTRCPRATDAWCHTNRNGVVAP